VTAVLFAGAMHDVLEISPNQLWYRLRLPSGMAWIDWSAVRD
jgi:hypothetical protein